MAARINDHRWHGCREAEVWLGPWAVVPSSTTRSQSILNCGSTIAWPRCAKSRQRDSCCPAAIEHWSLCDPLGTLYRMSYTIYVRASGETFAMITLYSYPTLFGVADNNGYGLKVFAFLRFVGLPFVHEHIFDASAAPRGQLPYIVDDGETVGDSDTIIAHLIGKYRLTIDAALGTRERDLSLLISRLLDDL